jgi:hypothetical protein
MQTAGRCGHVCSIATHATAFSIPNLRKSEKPMKLSSSLARLPLPECNIMKIQLGPGMVSNPFGSCRAFVETIVLDNCAACLDQIEQGGELDGRRLARDLFNAVVSLDAIIDYLWVQEGCPDDIYDFRKCIGNEVPLLDELHQLANAFKHCVRGHTREKAAKSTQEHAEDLLLTKVRGTVVTNLDGRVEVDASIVWELSKSVRPTLEAAFRFWLDLTQKDPGIGTAGQRAG